MLQKAIAADPHHGQTWQRVMKDPKNAGKDMRQLLELTSEAVEEEKSAAA